MLRGIGACALPLACVSCSAGVFTASTFGGVTAATTASGEFERRLNPGMDGIEIEFHDQFGTIPEMLLLACLSTLFKKDGSGSATSGGSVLETWLSALFFSKPYVGPERLGAPLGVLMVSGKEART